jgi:hypothetical protein
MLICNIFWFFLRPHKTGPFQTYILDRIKGRKRFDVEIRILGGITDPGCLSRIPDMDFSIPDPGSATLH